MLTRQDVTLISLIFTSVYLGATADDPTSANFASTLSDVASNSIISIGQALGNSAVSQPITQQNHTLAGSAAPIEVNRTLSAPWHQIANPFEATCAVRATPWKYRVGYADIEHLFSCRLFTSTHLGSFTCRWLSSQIWCSRTLTSRPLRAS